MISLTEPCYDKPHWASLSLSKPWLRDAYKGLARLIPKRLREAYFLRRLSKAQQGLLPKKVLKKISPIIPNNHK